MPSSSFEYTALTDREREGDYNAFQRFMTLSFERVIPQVFGNQIPTESRRIGLMVGEGKFNPIGNSFFWRSST